MVGAHVVPSLLSPKWSHVANLSNFPTQIYFNSSPRGIYRLAMDKPPDNDTPFPIKNFSPPPGRTAVQDIFLTSATLDNAIEIIPCQRELKTHSPVIGLLIRYRNGDQGCLGQFRLDCASTRLIIDRAQKLHLGFAQESSRYPYVAKLNQHPSSEKGGEEAYKWLELPWTGRVDWWFTDMQCKVSCAGQTSPPLFCY